MPISKLLLALGLYLIGLYLMWEVPTFESQKRLTIPSLKRFPIKVSIIIPARNEEYRIAPLLKSLSQQTVSPYEVIVVDDDSTDETAKVAAQWDATVIKGHPLPEGWTGKPWACWQGAQHAKGTLLLFIDADTWLEPDGLVKLVQAYQVRGGLLSVQPFHVVQKPYEHLSAFFNLVLVACLNAFTLLKQTHPPDGAFGPCLLCQRKDYFRIGGHRAIKSAILEGFPMSKLFLHHGLPVQCYGGQGALSFRMYPDGARDLIEGWSKGFGTGALSIKPFSLLLVTAWISGCFGASIALGRSLFAFSPLSSAIYSLIYLLYALQIHWMLKRIGNFSIYTALLFPVPLYFFALVVLRSFIYDLRDRQGKLARPAHQNRNQSPTSLT